IASRKRRWPSAKTMSNASVLLPEPETPVTTTNFPRGISTVMFLRLCSRAPWMQIESDSPRRLSEREFSPFTGEKVARRRKTANDYGVPVGDGGVGVPGVGCGVAPGAVDGVAASGVPGVGEV